MATTSRGPRPCGERQTFEGIGQGQLFTAAGAGAFSGATRRDAIRKAAKGNDCPRSWIAAPPNGGLASAWPYQAAWGERARYAQRRAIETGGARMHVGHGGRRSKITTIALSGLRVKRSKGIDHGPAFQKAADDAKGKTARLEDVLAGKTPPSRWTSEDGVSSRPPPTPKIKPPPQRRRGAGSRTPAARRAAGSDRARPRRTGLRHVAQGG